MENIYCFNNDCITECSRLIIHNNILFSFSCAFKANKNIFFLPNTFAPDNNYQSIHIEKFTNVRSLDVTKTTQTIDLKYFKNLEKLISLKSTEIFNPSKLTYLKCIHKNESNFNIEKYTNLKYLIHPYVKQIENLTNLQSFECTFENHTSDKCDLSSLYYLTKLYLVQTQKDKNYILQHVAISNEQKLIELHARNILFFDTVINGDRLKYLDMCNVTHCIFSHLKQARSINMLHVSAFSILNHNESYQHLTQMKINNYELWNFCNMTNLKHIEISKYKQSPSVHLSKLISLEKMTIEHNLYINDICVTSLTKLIHLKFINYIHKTFFGDAKRKEIPDEWKHVLKYTFRLPKNIKLLHYIEKSKLAREEKTYSRISWAHKIFIQINDLKYIDTLHVEKLELNDNNLHMINNPSLTKLILRKCKFPISNNKMMYLDSVKNLTLDKINMINVNTEYLSSLKKLTLKDCSFILTDQLNSLKALEVLKLYDMKCKLKLDQITTLTNLIIRDDSICVDIRKLCRLKRLSVSNPCIFFEMCLQKLPLSLKNVYIDVHTEIENDISKLSMKDVNLHFNRKYL